MYSASKPVLACNCQSCGILAVLALAADQAAHSGHSRVLKGVDYGSILLIVYAA
jgi:hypothetical protein